MQCVLQCPTEELITQKETRREFALTQAFLTLSCALPPSTPTTLSLSITTHETMILWCRCKNRLSSVQPLLRFNVNQVRACDAIFQLNHIGQADTENKMAQKTDLQNKLEEQMGSGQYLPLHRDTGIPLGKVLKKDLRTKC